MTFSCGVVAVIHVVALVGQRPFAQVLRNSRPEFRLSPPETISPARSSQIWPLKISPPVIAEDFGGGGLSLRRPVPTHGPVNGRCRRTTVRWRDERSEGLRCDSPSPSSPQIYCYFFCRIPVRFEQNVPRKRFRWYETLKLCHFVPWKRFRWYKIDSS